MSVNLQAAANLAQEASDIWGVSLYPPHPSIVPSSATPVPLQSKLKTQLWCSCQSSFFFFNFVWMKLHLTFFVSESFHSIWFSWDFFPLLSKLLTFNILIPMWHGIFFAILDEHISCFQLRTIIHNIGINFLISVSHHNLEIMYISNTDCENFILNKLSFLLMQSLFSNSLPQEVIRSV